MSRLAGTFEMAGQSWYIHLFDHNNLHRVKRQMGSIFYRALRKIKDAYGSDASTIWKGNPPSASVVNRFLQFEGCGVKIAAMAANILVRQYGIELSDYASIDLSPDVYARRMMKRLGLVPEGCDVNLIIYAAREISPDNPGIIDYPLWDIGQKICHAGQPACSECELDDVCPKLI